MRRVAELGQVFPEWVRPHRSGGSVLRAGALTGLKLGALDAVSVAEAQAERRV